MSWLDEVPQVKKSICGVKLRNGAIFSGVWGIASSVIYMGLELRDGTRELHQWLRNLLSAMATFFFLASIVLLIGIFKEKEVLCQIWIYSAIAFLICYSLVVLVSIFGFISHGQLWISWFTVGGILLFAVFVYLIVIVNSFRKTMEEDVYG